MRDLLVGLLLMAGVFLISFVVSEWCSGRNRTAAMLGTISLTLIVAAVFISRN